MPIRLLEYIQRALIAAGAVVLALVVFFMFRGVLETPAGDAAPVATTSVTTTTATPGTTVAPGETTTTTTRPRAAFVPPWTAGTCSDPEPGDREDTTVLRIYFTCGTPDAPTGTTFVYRRLPATNLVLTNTFRELVKGPTARESDLGFGSFFDGSVELASVSLREGRAVIDFGGLDGIADVFGTQQAVEFFLADLGANAFQFTSVQAVEYRADGDCVAFWELMGRSTCEVISRNQWLASVEPNR